MTVEMKNAMRATGLSSAIAKFLAMRATINTLYRLGKENCVNIRSLLHETDRVFTVTLYFRHRQYHMHNSVIHALRTFCMMYILPFENILCQHCKRSLCFRSHSYNCQFCMPDTCFPACLLQMHAVANVQGYIKCTLHGNLSILYMSSLSSRTDRPSSLCILLVTCLHDCVLISMSTLLILLTPLWLFSVTQELVPPNIVRPEQKKNWSGRGPVFSEKCLPPYEKFGPPHFVAEIMVPQFLLLELKVAPPLNTLVPPPHPLPLFVKNRNTPFFNK